MGGRRRDLPPPTDSSDKGLSTLARKYGRVRLSRLEGAERRCHFVFSILARMAWAISLCCDSHVPRIVVRTSCNWMKLSALRRIDATIFAGSLPSLSGVRPGLEQQNVIENWSVAEAT